MYTMERVGGPFSYQTVLRCRDDRVLTVHRLMSAPVRVGITSRNTSRNLVILPNLLLLRYLPCSELFKAIPARPRPQRFIIILQIRPWSNLQ